MYYYITRFAVGYDSNKHHVAAALYPMTVIGKDTEGNAEYKVCDSKLAIDIFDKNYTEDELLLPTIYLDKRYIEEFDDDNAAKCYFHLTYGY